MDIKDILNILSNDSAERLNDHEILAYFKQPPTIKNNYFYENKLVIGVRGAGKTMILKCFYRYLFTLMICEMTTKRPISYFPIFIQLDNQLNNSIEQINKHLMNKMIEGIYDTVKEISNSTKIHDWIEQYVIIPLEQMAQFDCFKDDVKLYYDASTRRFKYIDDFYNEMDDKGNIDKYMEKLRFFLNNISEEKEEITPIRLNKLCDFFHAEDNKIQKFMIFIDNICDFDDSYYSDHGEFNALLESFRQCGNFIMYISILKNSKAESIAKMNPLFTSASNIILSYDIINKESFLELRRFSQDVLKGYLGLRTLDDIIEIDDTPFEDEKENSDGDAFEQLLYASMGLPRAMLKILKIAINRKDLGHLENIDKDGIIEAIKFYADDCLKIPEGYGEYALQIEDICKKNKTFYFVSNRFDKILLDCSFNRNNEPFLLPCDEYRSTTMKKYMFHYSYCVQADIPTHISLSGDINDKRSIVNGKWIECDECNYLSIIYEKSKDKYSGVR